MIPANTLTPLDCRALLTGMSDAANGVHVPSAAARKGLAMRLHAFLVGGVANPLANPRLEALRQLALAITLGRARKVEESDGAEDLPPEIVGAATHYVKACLGRLPPQAEPLSPYSTSRPATIPKPANDRGDETQRRAITSRGAVHDA